MKRKYKSLFIFLSALLFVMTFYASINVEAASYNYDYFKKPIPSAEGLAYDSTYYTDTIYSADGTDGKISMDGLRDMDVYDGKIYMLNASKENLDVVLYPEYIDDAGNKIARKDVTFTETGQISIINKDFKWEKIVNEFPFSQEIINGVSIEERLIDELNIYYKLGEKGVALKDITKDQALSVAPEKRVPYLPYSKDYTRHALRLRNPQGITVKEINGEVSIFIADTDASQIVQLNENFEVINLYLTPIDPTFYRLDNYKSEEESHIRDEEFRRMYTISEKKPVSELGGTQFRPTKVAVDVSGRVYCIDTDVYEGIMEFSKADATTRVGTFNRFLGKNEVVANPLKAFWGKIFSDTQLGSLELDLPPRFTNITMDSDGFLYATSLPANDAELNTSQANMLKVINTAGKDVLRRNGYVKPNGDNMYIAATNLVNVPTGRSELAGVAVDTEKGIYTIVDSKRGRLFTYDTEGNLLYITGEQPGGTFTAGSGDSMAFIIINPVAINYFERNYEVLENGHLVNKKEDLLLILDAASRSLIVFKTTKFGELVNSATAKYQKGLIDDAKEDWEEVIKMNTNYELAYLGIGKSLLRKAGTIEEYKEAMDNFELAHNANYYSKAYSLYRDATMEKYFGFIMTSVLVIAVLIISLKVYKVIKRKNYQKFSEGGDE